MVPVKTKDEQKIAKMIAVDLPNIINLGIFSQNINLW